MKPWEDVANTINKAPDVPAGRREFGDPPMVKLRKFRDPNNNLIWFANDVSGGWFYEDAPQPWCNYRTDEDLVWWWNEKSGSWFYEPVS